MTPHPPRQAPGAAVPGERMASGSSAAPAAGTVSGSLRVQAANEWGRAACVLLSLSLSPVSQRAFLGSARSGVLVTAEETPACARALPTVACLGAFQVLPVMNKASVNVLCEGLGDPCFHFFGVNTRRGAGQVTG